MTGNFNFILKLEQAKRNETKKTKTLENKMRRKKAELRTSDLH